MQELVNMAEAMLDASVELVEEYSGDLQRAAITAKDHLPLWLDLSKRVEDCILRADTLADYLRTLGDDGNRVYWDGFLNRLADVLDGLGILRLNQFAEPISEVAKRIRSLAKQPAPMLLGIDHLKACADTLADIYWDICELGYDFK